MPGYVFTSNTAHPTYGGYRNRSPFWLELPSSQRVRFYGASTFSHIWIGALRPDGSVDSERQRLLAERVRVDGKLVAAVPLRRGF